MNLVLKQDDPRVGFELADGGLEWPALDCFGDPYERRAVVVRRLPALGFPARFVVIPPAQDSNDLSFVLEVKAQFSPTGRKAKGDGESNPDQS